MPDAVAPPLGCSFHPRCPKAFEVCGWESRDLRDLLERWWTRIPEAEFEGERGIVGDLDTLDEPSSSARLEAGSGHSGRELLDLLTRIRVADPQEPFWRGVRELTPDDRGVTVRFHDGIDPGLVPDGRQEVACLLYDPQALVTAEGASGERRASKP